MNDGENNVTTSHDEKYADVSLRAVELLAKAQRAADEAVAEAQSYARDLEKSAREQYKQILQRAQSAAQQVATAEGAGSEHAAPGEATSVDAQQLAYVRTYARVAHTQLKSVLAALNDELDQLAAMAEGAGREAATPPPPPATHQTPGSYGSPPQHYAPSTPEPFPTAAPVTPAPLAPAPPVAPVVPPPAPPARPVAPPPPPPSYDMAEQTRQQARRRPSPEPPETNGTPSWPPILPSSNSISYFHRGGSNWEGPH